MNIMQNLAGLGDMTEQIIATDFLISTKSAIKDYAVAISETTTPQVREVLKRQLDDAIKTHEAVLRYMIGKNYYYVHEPWEQIMVDLTASNTTMNLQ